MSTLPAFETPFPAPRLSFACERSSEASTSARVGAMRFTGTSGPPEELETPCIVQYTKKGSPVHLTQDNVDRGSIRAVSVAIEHLLDYNPPVYTSAPFPLAKYLGLRSRLASTSAEDRKGKGPHITFTALRDPSDLTDVSGNTDGYVTCRSFRGVNKVTPKQYLSYALPRPADITIAIADEPVGSSTAHSQKRITRSMLRSEKWLAETVEAAKETTNVFAPLVGGASAAARTEYTNTLVHDQRFTSVSGFSLNLNTLRIPSTASSSANAEPEQVVSLVDASLAGLSASKPRLAFCPAGPHEMLRLLGAGIDMFMDDWSTLLSSIGVALDFSLNPSEAGTEGNKRELGINLFDDVNSDQFVPLASTALHARLEAVYGSEALGDTPTRGYVHHLLHTHEMTSHVLLAMHNTCVMDLFLADVRKSIRAGRFAENKQRFEEIYSEHLGCLDDAKQQYDKVNRERGKGRLKGLGQERREVATPVEEQERMSVVDPASVSA